MPYFNLLLLVKTKHNEKYTDFKCYDMGCCNSISFISLQ